jgi:hypothetical protein
VPCAEETPSPQPALRAMSTRKLFTGQPSAAGRQREPEAAAAEAAMPSSPSREAPGAVGIAGRESTYGAKLSAGLYSR